MSTTAIITSSRSGYVRSNNPNTSIASTAVYATWNTGTGYYEYGYYLFDISFIPAGSIINNAYLTLTSYNSGSTSTDTIQVFKSTSAWASGPLIYNTRPSVEGSPFQTFTGITKTSSLVISMTSVIQSWVNGAVNGGIMLANATAGGSKSWCAEGVGDVNSRPKLTIDYTVNTAPNAPILGFTDGQVLNTRKPTITWTFSDSDSGDSQSQYFVEVINGSYSAPLWNSGWIANANARSYTLPAGAIPSDGQCYIRMKVTDSQGAVNQSNGNGPDTSFGNRRLIIDTVAPTIASVSTQQFNKNANTTTRVWAYGLSDTTSGVSYVTVFLVRPDGSYYQTNNGINAGNGNWYIDVTWNNDVQGNWGVDFRGVDAAGNTGNMARANVYVDSTSPTIASVQGYSYTNQTTGTRRVWAYGVTDNGSGINQVLCNYTVPGKSTVSSVNCTASGSDFFIDIPLSVQGEYRVEFYCIDRAGNWMSNPNSKTASFFVDSQRPNDPDPNVSYGTTTALFSWKSFSDPSPSSGYDKTYMYLGEWNGSGWVGTPLYNGTSIGNVLTLAVNGLKQGARYRYTVTQYDKSGNESSYTYKEFVTKRKIGEYRIQKSGQLLSLPVYDPNSGINGPKTLRTSVTAGIGCLELVPVNDPNASPIRLVTSQGVKAISK
ncbi:DNRLRE domain-containing protein [Paenibacillus sp. TAB 01]|uniref:DNRLRE domain-containing protein n=1 Tax=Paenibacillus sp. TAB 01 TaxID=3368988 RepID=UPI003751D3CD